MVYYDLFGLRVAVNIPLPCLIPVTDDIRSPDINIIFGELPADIARHSSIPEKVLYRGPQYGAEPPYLEISLSQGGEYYRWHYAPGVDFAIDNAGTSVWCAWSDVGTLEQAIISLTGPVLGFILRLRGTVCLHASGIVCGDDTAFAICGVSGAGKSSLAAAFSSSGLQILTDDIMPLYFNQEVLMAKAGYPRINLFPDAYQYIEKIPSDLPRLSENWDKCYLDLHKYARFSCRKETELKTVYILDWSSHNPVNEIQTLTPSRALSLLAANTYYTELLNTQLRKQEFSFLGRVVEKIPVRQLRPVNNMRLIRQLADTILENYSAVAA